MAKSLQEIKNKMKKLVEDTDTNKVYHIVVGENTMNGEHDYSYLSNDGHYINDLSKAKVFNSLEEAEKEAEILANNLQQASVQSGGYYDYDIDIVDQNGNSVKTIYNIKEDVNTDTDRIDNTVYVLNCSEDLTGYTSLIGYFPTLETAKEAAKRDLAANGNREDVLHYSVDLYIYKDTVTL